jgi:3-oxoacyl-[acyl-carrier-protein] synthase II
MTPLAITGMSAITGFGVGLAAFTDGLRSGRTTIAPVEALGTNGSRSHLAGQIRDFDPAQFIAPGKLRRIDRVGRLSIACCKLAMESAGLTDLGPIGADGVGVALGSYTSGIHSLVEYLDRLIAQGPTGGSALDFSNTVGNAAASLCGIELGLRGANVTLNSKEASALAAVAYAASLLESGRARALISGGVDDLENTFFAVHAEFGVLANDEGEGEASRPFDRRRNGFILGTGAFLVVLETTDSARARAAGVHGELAAVAATSAPARLNDWPRDSGELARCMRVALDRANREPRDVAAVFASANSTPVLDRTEAAALAEVFGESTVPVTALKGALGECGAIGAAGLIAAIGCLRDSVIPPTVGFAQPDPDCPVNVSSQPRSITPRPHQVALVNSFASGGASYSAVVRA